MGRTADYPTKGEHPHEYEFKVIADLVVWAIQQTIQQKENILMSITYFIVLLAKAKLEA